MKFPWNLVPGESWRESFGGHISVKKMCPAESDTKSEISAFYAEKCVFITGATGFLGTVLVEKLLRSCSGVKRIYILVRPKKGLEPNQRVQELFKATILENLLKEHPEAIEKVIPIKGDITLDGLGISNNDWSTLINEVSVVFHSAATVRFDEPLKVAVNYNVLGTRRVLELCHKMTHLVALVHVSTAYANCDRKEVEEVIYPPPVAANNLIDTMKWMDDEIVDQMTPILLGKRPNTYTYTKAVTEAMLEEEGQNLPIAIVRPSIVTGTWREPTRGWVNNLNGPQAIFLAWGNGILRTMQVNNEAKADWIPVDVVINLMLVVGWFTASKIPKGINIYNCTSGQINPLTWGRLSKVVLQLIVLFPVSQLFRYPSSSTTDSRLVNQLKGIVDQAIPAYLIDTASALIGKKQIMTKIYHRLDRGKASLEWFTTRDWNFKSENIDMLWGQLQKKDKELFNFDIRDLYWPSYIQDYILGIRRHLAKEDFSTLPVARKRLARVYLRDKIFFPLILCLIVYLISVVIL